MKKKIFEIGLIVSLALGIMACGKTEGGAASDNGSAVKIESAVKGFENIWSLYSDEDMFPAMGGDMDNMVDGNPGACNVTNTNTLTGMLYVPEEQIGNLDEAASLLHMMNANTFTGVVARVSDTKVFADDWKADIDNAVWICGSPEKLIIAEIGDGYVAYAFGESSIITTFSSKLKEAYPGAKIFYEEDIVIAF